MNQAKKATKPLASALPPAVLRQLERLKARPVTRLIALGNQVWSVTLTDVGVTFRLHRHRYQLPLAWLDVLSLAERRAGEAAAEARTAS